MRLNINFLVRPSKVLKNGLWAIECSTTINGKRIYQRLPRQIKLSNWNQSKQQVRGNSLEAR